MTDFYEDLEEPEEPKGYDGDGDLLIDDDLDGEGAFEK